MRGVPGSKHLARIVRLFQGVLATIGSLGFLKFLLSPLRHFRPLPAESAAAVSAAHIPHSRQIVGIVGGDRGREARGHASAAEQSHLAWADLLALLPERTRKLKPAIRSSEEKSRVSRVFALFQESLIAAVDPLK
jgi:hypothetical protein